MIDQDTVIGGVRGAAPVRLRGAFTYQPLTEADTSGTQLARFRMLLDRVLVEPLGPVAERFATKVGALWTPDKPEQDARDAPLCKGRVIKIGPGDKYKWRAADKDGHREAFANADGARWPMAVQPGDLILYSRWQGNTVTLDGKEYLVFIDEQHCMAVIEEHFLDDDSVEALEPPPISDAEFEKRRIEIARTLLK